MIPDELPSLAQALGLAFVGAPFLAAALRRSARVLPQRPAPADHWPLGEALAVALAPFLLVGALAWLGGGTTRAEGEGDVLFALVGTQLVLASAVGLALLLAARRPRGLAALGLTGPPEGRAIGSVFLVYVPGFLCASALAIPWLHLCRARGWPESQEVSQMIQALRGSDLALATLLAVVLGPLIEELLFRGFLQSFLGQVVGERAGLLLTSAIFARLHGLAGLPVLFLLSLYLGWLRQRTRSLWLPCLVHGLNNAVSLGLALALGGG